MFEGHINRASFGVSRESEDLRRFRWTDLVARLAATRELRDELSKHGEGDFSAFATVRREGEEGKPSVNHEGSTYRKATALKLDATAKNAVQGDRETE